MVPVARKGVRIRPRWEEREAVHTFEDGWTIEWLRTKRDLRLENRLLFYGNACLEEKHWPDWIEGGSYLMLSLRDPDGFPKATILLGNHVFVATNRMFDAHPGYCFEHIFDQRPRRVGDFWVIALQCCPAGYPDSDRREKEDETKRVKAWYEALPTTGNELALVKGAA
jgi:hypothetical protein